MRYDAWEGWHIAGFIGAIPALLEIALILFFVGLVVFAWTLQRLIFALVATVVGLVLIVVVVLTLLPVFSRLCPCKSPTGWAFARTSDVLTRLCRRYFTSDTRILTVASNWRTWDLFLASDTRTCRLPAGGIPLVRPHKADYEGAAVDAVQLNLLIRALVWVRQGTNQYKLLKHVDDCLHIACDSFRMPDGYQAYVDVVAYPMRLSMRLPQILPSLASYSGGIHQQTKPPTYRVSMYNASLNPVLCVAASERWIAQVGPYITDTVARYGSRPTDPALLFVSRRLLFVAVSKLVGRWVHATANPASRPTAQYYHSRIVDGFQTLRCIPRDCLTDPYSRDLASDLKTFAEVLTIVYQQLSQFEVAYRCGLVSMVLNLLWSMGNVSFSDNFSRCTVKGKSSNCAFAGLLPDRRY